MVNAIFERFLESNHLTMMVWAILARIFAPEALDELFEKEQLLVMQSEFPSLVVQKTFLSLMIDGSGG